MDTIKGVMERIKAASGVNIPFEQMTWMDYAKIKCEEYNNSTGRMNEIDGYNCEKCKNRGDFAKMQQVNGGWYEIHPACECQKIRRTILRLKKSGLKNIITEYTFDKYIANEPWKEAVKKKAVDYARNPEKSWFFIGGQNGAGKTHLCTAIAGHFLKSGKNVRYMLWRDDITKLKSNITDAQAYEEAIHSLKTAEVLYIDDLFKNGKGNDGKVIPPTASDIQIAFELINYRYINKDLITIISSERTLNDLLDIDEALAGRIAEMSSKNGNCINIAPDRKKNYRLNGATEF